MSQQKVQVFYGSQWLDVNLHKINCDNLIVQEEVTFNDNIVLWPSQSTNLIVFSPFQVAIKYYSENTFILLFSIFAEALWNFQILLCYNTANDLKLALYFPVK